MTDATEPPIRVFAASRDGQAVRIAMHVAQRLRADGRAVECRRLAPPMPTPGEVAPAALVVLVAAVRYGRHLEEASTFLDTYRALPSPPPLALASVCLTARKPNRRTAQDNPYLRKLIARHRLAPAVARAFPGVLDYPRYGWLDRHLIRFIMWMTDGPTDGTSRIEYTDWDEIEAFAGELGLIARG
ncbi:flavodoxin domain-containing protein [Blastochloris tepida]|uniref:Protoporphyrinogen oxidase n=1 Tax=Blastochloris tepida TaxID=2233851 RepID=A0A348FZ66_9HYPH|nr:flavodoxin domain-containing protein [Blastochloris tepida]BBF92599.1 protoporphyrinogen oxidase [Blastochloris tepida]